ncbi:MAG: DNA-3-methyladenine glycosylase family protein [Promethearchaeota archaeon]
MVELVFPETYDLSQTFDCGQIFRFHSSDNGKTYYGPLSDRIIKLTQINEHTLEISSSQPEGLRLKIHEFLRVKDDYITIQNSVKVDPLMEKVIQKTNGLHLVKQDSFECAISYLLSQCSNIPRITQNLSQLSEMFGKRIIFDDQIFYLFPKREDLLQLGEDDFREMSFGYRAKYIASFIHDYPQFLRKPKKKGEDFNRQLQKIYGIGQKVADCIQLFGYGDLTLFPVDTWMRKFMIKYYFSGKKPSNAKIRALGRQMFGQWAGYAQEFIFHYARHYDNR